MKTLFRKIFGKANVYDKLRSILAKYFPKNFYFRSYSQWGEDAVLSQFFHEKNGSYIDIGSGDPIVGNNTFFLYLRGWKGILVDPIKKNIEQSSYHRKKDKHVNKTVTNKAQSLFLWEFKNYGLSTVDKKRANMLQSQGHILKDHYEVESITINELIKEFFSGRDILPQLLSIDVEGHELEVLKSNNWNTWQPRVICIEILVNDLFQITPAHTFLFNLGYSLKASVGNSHIFVKEPVFRK